MKVTRRQSLVAVAAAVGAAVLRAVSLGRLRWTPRLAWQRPEGEERHARGDVRRAPSLRVNPAPHSVKRHG